MASNKRNRTEQQGGWVSGGELGIIGGPSSQGQTPQALKRTIVDILMDGETTTKALRRLRPAPAAKKGPRPRNAREREAQKSAAAADALLQELEGDEAEEQRARNVRLFEALTEAADELMSLGFEDIYMQTREHIASSLEQGFKELEGRGMFVWHDDGTVKDEQRAAHPMYQRDRTADLLTFSRDQERGGTAVPPPSQGSSKQGFQNLEDAQQEVLARLAGSGAAGKPKTGGPPAEPSSRDPPSADVSWENPVPHPQSYYAVSSAAAGTSNVYPSGQDLPPASSASTGTQHLQDGAPPGGTSGPDTGGVLSSGRGSGSGGVEQPQGTGEPSEGSAAAATAVPTQGAYYYSEYYSQSVPMGPPPPSVPNYSRYPGSQPQGYPPQGYPAYFSNPYGAPMTGPPHGWNPYGPGYYGQPAPSYNPAPYGGYYPPPYYPPQPVPEQYSAPHPPAGTVPPQQPSS
eukprot:jgi/Botrbrau1/20878/Bobra.0135s0011.1